MTAERAEEVVGDDAAPIARGVIVVGVDGSETSVPALRWAADEAHRRHATLRVVIAWHGHYQMPVEDPAMPDAAPIPELEVGPEVRTADAVDDMGRTDAQETVRRMLRQIGRDVAGLQVEIEAVRGDAAPALLGAARDAALLVVGTRGRGGFKGLLLGSVSAKVTHHAPCPVVVVPHPPSTD